nr:YfhO family protein [Liquorilactobacillus mali]
MRGAIYSKENTYLYSTISVERGWTVKVNGKVIHPQVFAGTFMKLPIKAGNNKISMTYKTPYLGLGIIVSILSIILIIIYLIVIKKYINKL